MYKFMHTSGIDPGGHDEKDNKYNQMTPQPNSGSTPWLVSIGIVLNSNINSYKVLRTAIIELSIYDYRMS